eukprot:scaffold8600_cov48-Phaeocystis_antarctica.AAC.3
MSCVRCSMNVLSVRLFCPWSVSRVRASCTVPAYGFASLFSHNESQHFWAKGYKLRLSSIRSSKLPDIRLGHVCTPRGADGAAYELLPPYISPIFVADQQVVRHSANLNWK